MNSRLAVAEFDEYARSYDAALARGLSATGESKDFFAQARVRWVKRCLDSLNSRAEKVLDYGCGTGSAVPWLQRELRPRWIVGVDLSVDSLAEATVRYGSPSVTFHSLEQFRPESEVDLIFCNGVFHHIPLGNREAALGYLVRALKPGGLFAFWENNPWNPGTRYVMSRVPFDRDAITLSAPSARRLLATAGFTVLRTDFLFIFPRMLKWLRGLEPYLTGLPLGGQYQILCRKS